MENKKLTQQELESHLWGAADILRGAIDAADYKHYIFGLLFYKRLSDVWVEEYEERLKEFEDEELAKDPEEHRFHIPEGCFWSDVKKKTTNIGEALNSSFRAIEDSNKRLNGVFQDVDFNNKRRFPDSTLELLIQHFDKYSLMKKNVPSDMLGNAYEYLIAKFADDAGSKGGEFYTPKEVVQLIVELLKPSEGASVYDPTCGSAGMLLEAFHYMERNKKNPKSLRLFGQEKNINTWAISQMNLFLHDIDDARVVHGDTLKKPLLFDDEASKKIKTFDFVIANPPFSLKNWGQEIWKGGDPYGRDLFGCPPKSYADFAFVQHMIKSLNSNGRLGVIVPHGILFRGNAEGKIRTALFENEDILDAVIGLPEGLFYGTGIPTALLIFKKKRDENRKKKLLFINAELLYEDRKIQRRLRSSDIDKIVETYSNYTEENRFSIVVSHKELGENDYNLNIRRYIDTAPPLTNYDVEHILKGGIPKYELEDEYFIELMEGLDVESVFEIKGDSIRFQPVFKLKSDLKKVIGDERVALFNLLSNIWDNYTFSLNQVNEQLGQTEKKLNSFLKELGYE
ncbi:type I restriction-modification system subunit M [Halobacteriovorax sp.]|uniref:type I restriction-modification system subunit M n=1 Tax=Halobacteriovorax sp. TaxID=2020862 RepID=UPI003AF25F16